uniref:Uncharacterized protein n=1 Tax=Caenorhabditis japonica TaxID=281687 RepID=A0A8R1E3X6_CAEJA
MHVLKGFIVWILMSTILVTCYTKEVPVKRRMMLRLPFVHNQEASQVSFQPRTFLRMMHGNSKIKKAAEYEPERPKFGRSHVYMLRRFD